MGRAQNALKYPQDYKCMLVLMNDDLEQIQRNLPKVSEQEVERVWAAVASVKSREM